jgi:hypothetical protein
MYDWHVEASVQGAPSGDRGVHVIVVVSQEDVVRQASMFPAQELPSGRRGSHVEPVAPAAYEQ